MRDQILAASLVAASGEAGKRTKDLIFYAGETVDRFDWNTWEEYELSFSLDPKHVDLSRLNAGAAVLLDHVPSVDRQVGVCESASVESGQGLASVRFSDNPEVDGIWNDVSTGIIRNVSMGAFVNDMKEITPKGQSFKSYLAVDWQPNHIALVAIPADPGAQFLSAFGKAPSPEMAKQFQAFLAAKKNSDPGAARSEDARERLNFWLSLRGK